MNTQAETVLQTWLEAVHIKYDFDYEITEARAYGLTHKFDFALMLILT
jgi:hypothetical protein